MRQILLNSGGAVVARVPRPLVERGSVLVRVQYSLISVGTEIAPLRSMASQAPDTSAIERGVEYASLARHYFRASLRDPKKAMDRVSKILRAHAAKLKSARPVQIVPAISGELTWMPANPDITLTTGDAGGRSRATLTDVNAGMAPPTIGGLPLSELDVQGWGVGYSAAGEVVAVGAGVTDLAAGDLVACAGAGQANHADFINVKRNLVARVPAGCPINLAASTTV